MKRFAAFLVLVTALFASGWLLTKGCQAAEKDAAAGGSARSGSAGPLFRWHHAGRAALALATNALTLKKIDALPASETLRGQIATSFARATPRIWEKSLPAGAADPTKLLQPLGVDFLTAESYVEVRGAVGRTETVLAIELNDARARAWSTNLWQLMSLWKLGEPRGITAEGFGGWELKKSSAPNVFQFIHAGKWVVIGLGQDKLKLAPALVQRTKQSQRPVPALSPALLDLEADLPGLQPWIPLLTSFPLPPVHLTMTGRGENVRTEARFQFPGKVPGILEPWKIPTNLVSEPLSSFTVARGVAPWLEKVKPLKELGLQPMPNQICAWGITNDMARFYFTVPVSDATNTIKQLAPKVPPLVLNSLGNILGQFVYVSNRAELDWTGLPFIHPFIKATRGPGSEFVLGGVFFLAQRNFPVPPELYAQLADRGNLVYYDWELSESRLDHGRQFYDLANIVSSRWTASATNTVSRAWMSAVAPLLHDSVTEITQSGPQEMLLVRKSSIGFTGFELATMSAWMDSPNFPFKIDLQPLIGAGRTNRAGRADALPGKPKPVTP